MSTTRNRRLRRASLGFALIVGFTVVQTRVEAIPLSGNLKLTAPASSVWSEQVILTAKVTALPKTAKATGTVTFADDGDPLGTVALGTGGGATLRTRDLTVGVHSITADYSGDAHYGPSLDTAEITVSKGATTTTVLSTKATVAKGKPAQFEGRTTRVAPASASAAGSTVFTATAVGVATVTGTVPTTTAGRATWKPVLGEGDWTVTATFQENDTWSSSSSAPLSQVVGEVLDAANTAGYPNRALGWYQHTAYGNGQTFTAAHTGKLTKVEIRGYTQQDASVTPDLRVSIRALDLDGNPTGPDLAFGTITPAQSPVTNVEVPLTAVMSTPVPVVAGTGYAILVNPTQPELPVGWVISEDPSNNYAGGRLLTGVNGEFEAFTFDWDMPFRTWVTVS